MKTIATEEREDKTYDLDYLLDQFSVSLRNHSRRVAVCSAIIAEHANASKNYYDVPIGMSLPVIVYTGGTCHDIGKLMLPTLEAKDGDYKKHPIWGAELLKKHNVTLFGNKHSVQMVLDIVSYHHERADGAGFPKGLKAGDIPLIAGICSIANKLDHDMYWGNKRGNDEVGVYKTLEAQAGKHFCECIWDCVERAWSRLVERYAYWNNFACNHDGAEPNT